MLKVAHIAMLDAAMNLNLTHELLFGSALRQTALLNNLSCVNETRIGIYELVALGEAALAQEFALNVPSDTNLARAVLFEFLLHDGLRGAPRLVRLSDMVHFSLFN